MLDSIAAIKSPTRCRRGITNPVVIRRLEEAKAEPHASIAEQLLSLPPSGPEYEFWRPWYERFISKSCGRCGDEPIGWLQQQITTPSRTKRFLLWLVNLVPRGVSFTVALTGGKIDADAKAERDRICESCAHARIQLRVIGERIHETGMFCSLCQCGRWRLARLKEFKNWLRRWHCPARRHAGSDRWARHRAYRSAALEARTVEVESAGTPVDAGNGRRDAAGEL